MLFFLFDKFVLSPGRDLATIQSAKQQAAQEAAKLALASAFDRSIAVLRFVNGSGNSTYDYISDGLSDELRDRLAELPGLRVMARSSSIRCNSSDTDIVEIGKQLRVSRLIEGRFNREGNRIVVSVQVIDATTGFQLWSHSFERASRDLLLMQQELSRAVTAQLLPELAPPADLSALADREVSAHELLLLGRHYEQQVTDLQTVDEEKLQQAIEYYRLAVAEDPGSAEAHARLGKMLLYLGDVDAAQDPIFEALRLDPRLSDAQATLGLYHRRRAFPRKKRPENQRSAPRPRLTCAREHLDATTNGNKKGRRTLNRSSRAAEIRNSRGRRRDRRYRVLFH